MGLPFRIGVPTVIRDPNFVPGVKKEVEYYCDRKRHLVCVPYNKENLHEMAKALDIKRHWFHKDHYDIPSRRIKEITAKCTVVSQRDIWKIIHNVKSNG